MKMAPFEKTCDAGPFNHIMEGGMAAYLGCLPCCVSEVASRGEMIRGMSSGPLAPRNAIVMLWHGRILFNLTFQ